VLLAEKSIVNRHTTQEGVRQPQEVEMRAPGQLGLPGGQSRKLRGYRLAKQPLPDPQDEPDLGRLAIESGADEALAETGINVRSKAFERLGFTYARDSKEDAFENERTHAYFLYQGRISELAQRANEVLSVKGAADDEVSRLLVVPLSHAVSLMKQTFASAKKQGHGLDEYSQKRFVGDGFDWHAEALGELSRERHARREEDRPPPRPLAQFPDAVKWIRPDEETALPPMLQPLEQQPLAMNEPLPSLRSEPGPSRDDLADVKSALSVSLTEPQAVTTVTKKVRSTQGAKSGQPITTYILMVLTLLALIVALIWQFRA